MNKLAENLNFDKSTFTVTFAIELVGIDVWHDCNEGWLDLGPCSQGVRIQYQLYPGQSFDLDVLVWPHCAKIWCAGQHYGWARTWQYLERRWVSFGIRHAFPVRILELRDFVASITPVVGLGALGSTAKNDKNFEIYLPPLRFGERRYFGRVTEIEDEPLTLYISGLIWSTVLDRIPSSFLDGLFDVPHVVTDVRHQDAILYQVQQLTLNKNVSEESVVIPEPEDVKGKDKKQKSPAKKSNEALKSSKYELKLSGDSILSGTGRIIPFDVVGNHPADVGEVVALLSSNILPAQDDLPMVFVNMDCLMDIPVEEFKKAGVYEVYGKWSLGDEVRCSQPQPIRSKSEICLNDHHSVPLEIPSAPKILASFLENSFEIEVLGTRKPVAIDVIPKFFNKDSSYLPIIKDADYENDIILAVCKVDASQLSKGSNAYIQGEYPLYPPKVDIVNTDRHAICTNDVNAVRAATKPQIIVPPSIILEAQMTLQVGMGYVGCIAKLNQHFSRMYCIVYTEVAANKLVKFVTNMNEKLKADEQDIVTGFAVDTGSEVILYVEGSNNKNVREIWEFTAMYHNDLDTWFSTTARFSTRLYESLLTTEVPWMILKMHVPLSSLLSCPSVYIQIAVPSPAKATVLKFGRLLGRKLRNAPCSSEMPTMSELQSFRLEMCAPLKPSFPHPVASKII